MVTPILDAEIARSPLHRPLERVLAHEIDVDRRTGFDEPRDGAEKRRMILDRGEAAHVHEPSGSIPSARSGGGGAASNALCPRRAVRAAP